MQSSVVLLALLFLVVLLLPASSSPPALERVRIGDYEAALCPQATCRGRCGDRESPVCQCHPTCMMLGDCCLDYQAVCMTNTSFSASNLTAEYEERRRAQALMERCTEDRASFHYFPNVSVVSKCPASYTGNQREECESCTPTSWTLPLLTPVYSMTSGMVFRNEFCAACHGESELVHIALNVSCAAKTAEHAVTPYIENGLQDMLTHVFTTKTVYGLYKCVVSLYLYGLPLPLWRLESHASSMYYCSAVRHNTELMNIASSYRSPIIRPQYCDDEYMLDYECANLRKFHIHTNWHRVHGCSKDDFVCTSYHFTHLPEPSHDPNAKVIVRYQQGVAKVYYGQQLLCERHSSIADILTDSCVEKTACPEAHVHRHGTCYPVPLSREDSVRGVHENTVEVVVATTQAVDASNLMSFFSGMDNLLQAGEIQAEWVTGNCFELSGIPPQLHCLVLVLSGPPASRLLSVASFRQFRLELFRGIGKLFGEAVPRYIALRNFGSAARLRCEEEGALRWLERAAVVSHAVTAQDVTRQDGLLRVMDRARGLLYAANTTALYMLWTPAGDGDRDGDGDGDRDGDGDGDRDGDGDGAGDGDRDGDGDGDRDGDGDGDGDQDRDGAGNTADGDRDGDFVWVKHHPAVAVCVSPTNLLNCPTTELLATQYTPRSSDADTFSFTVQGSEDGKEERILSLPKSRVLIDANNTLVTCEALYKEALNTSTKTKCPCLLILLGIIVILFL